MASPGESPKQRILVVGSHSRNTGKTALVADIIRAFPDAAWTAVKVTEHGHGEFAAAEQSFALDEDHDHSNRTDSSRFLVAGAARSFWLRTKQDHLAEALPALRAALASASNVVIESNSLLQFLKPDLYLVVLDPLQPDFKTSARQFLDRADAFVLRHPLPATGKIWPDVSPSQIRSKPSFLQPLGEQLPSDLLEFVRAKLWPSGRF